MNATMILSGIPGNMCRQIASVAIEEPYCQHVTLATAGFAEPGMKGQTVEMAAGKEIKCHAISELRSLLTEYMFPNPIIVDYTSPQSALPNITAYARAGVPFVIGTTGYDREAAIELVKASSASAVIAPNMGAPIVLIQAALRYLAETFPGALDGYSLSITESHQKPKKDASGTARAFQPLLERVGAKPAEEIVSIRDEEKQRELGVPEEHLAGHGWHWYELRSPGGDVVLEFSHRVNGRRVYAEGTLRAVEFLARKVREGSSGEVFTMEDVLGG